MKKIIRLLAVLLLISTVFALASCNKQDSTDDTVSGYISLVNKNIKFNTINEQKKIEYVATADIKPEDLVFYCSDETIATCENGIITSRGFGICTVMIKHKTGKLLGSCKVSVNEENMIIKLSHKEYEFTELGATLSIEATNADGYSVHNVIQWITSDRDVATVKDGVVTARGYGACTIRAWNSKYNVYATCIVKVIDPNEPEATITLPEGENRVNLDNIGDEYKLTAVAYPNPSDTFTWQSSDESVATVDANGKVKAVGNGRCVIIAKCSNGKSTACLVNVGNTPDGNELPTHIINFTLHNIGDIVQVRNSDGAITAKLIVLSYNFKHYLENDVLYIEPVYNCVKIYDVNGNDGTSYVDAQFNLFAENNLHCESRTYRVFDKKVGDTFEISGRKFGINVNKNEPRSFYMTISLLAE